MFLALSIRLRSSGRRSILKSVNGDNMKKKLTLFALVIFCLCSFSCTLAERAKIVTTMGVISDLAEVVLWLDSRALQHQTPEELMESFKIANSWVISKDYLGDDVKEAFAFISGHAEAIKWLIKNVRTYKDGELTPARACALVIEAASFWRPICK